MICLTCDRQGGRGKESPHPRPTKRQCSAGGGNHHKVSFHARELAPKGDNLIHAHFRHTRKPGYLMKPCREFF